MIYIHEFTWTAPASTENTFQALTDPSVLQKWFAEHVEVEGKEGGTFRFWGKHTIETPTKAQASQKITSYDPPNCFGFTWPLLGIESTVTFALDAGADGTTISGRHSFAEAPTGVRVKELIDDLWRLHGGNFVTYLKGGDGFLLPDYNDPDPEIRQSILIEAPREAVFAALITPEMMAEWIWAENAVVEPHLGGKYSYGWRYEVGGHNVAGGPTKILEYIENEKLVTDWPDWRGDSSVPVQTITWLLADEGDYTRVTVIHSGFTRPSDISDYPFGWDGFISKLKNTVEKK